MQIRTLAGVAAVIALASCEKPAAPAPSAPPAPAPAAETAPAVPVTPPPAAAPAPPAPVPAETQAPAAPPAETPAATADAGPAGQKLLTDLNALADELTKHAEASKGQDQMTSMKGALPIMKKLSEVKTQDLPADLDAAFKTVQTSAGDFLADIEKIPADMPSDQAAMGEWIGKHPEVMTILTGLAAKGQAMQDSQKGLEEAGAKYGLDFSKFFNAGNPQ